MQGGGDGGMMRVLILGGNGFIGKNLADMLAANGESVTSFDLRLPAKRREKIRYVAGDFFDRDALDECTEGVDTVFHCICTINPGNSEELYFQGYEKDFIQTIRLLEIAKRKGIRVIFLSSGGTVYGEQEQMPVREECVMKPINHYGNLKVCIENMMRIFNRLEGTDMKIARIANPYGPGQDYKKGVGFIDAALKSGLCGQALQVWGKGDIVRDYIYIEDVCGMLYAIARYEGEEEVFNLGTSDGRSQNDILAIARKWFPGLRVEYREAREVDVRKIVLDNRKILKIYGKKPIMLEEGMERYYRHLARQGTAGP